MFLVPQNRKDDGTPLGEFPVSGSKRMEVNAYQEAGQGISTLGVSLKTRPGNDGEGVGRRVLWPFLVASPQFLGRKDLRVVLKLHLRNKLTFP